MYFEHPSQRWWLWSAPAHGIARFGSLAVVLESLNNRSVSTYRIIYVSRVARQVRFADAEEIARQAAARNAECGVTGMLVYTPSHFIQVLEGRQSDVESTFARIQRDPRHTHIRTVTSQAVEANEFGAWAMVARRTQSLNHQPFDQISTETALEILREAQSD